MKTKKNKQQKDQEVFNLQEKDIDDLIDDVAYLDKKGNIRKSKSFLDSMYLLDD